MDAAGGHPRATRLVLPALVLGGVLALAWHATRPPEEPAPAVPPAWTGEVPATVRAAPTPLRATPEAADPATPGPAAPTAPRTEPPHPAPEVAARGAARGPAIPWERLRPELSADARDRNRLTLLLDDATYDALRSGGIRALAEGIKTEPYVEPGASRPSGLRIVGVAQGLDAGRFGFRRGDLLVSIAGRPVRSRADAVAIAQELDPGTGAVEVELDRNGRRIQLVVDPRDPRTRRALGRALPAR